MKFIKQTKFWKLPVALKLVVLWFLLAVLIDFGLFLNFLVVKHILDFGPLIRGVIELCLAIGLIHKSNESRGWAAFFVFLGCLFALFFLMIGIFEYGSVEGINISYGKFTQAQIVVFLMMYLSVSVGVLFVLLRPETRAFFLEESDLYKTKEDVNISYDHN